MKRRNKRDIDEMKKEVRNKVDDAKKDVKDKVDDAKGVIKDNVPFYKSIAVKIVALVFCAVLVSSALSVWSVTALTKKQVEGVVEDYMMDSAKLAKNMTSLAYGADKNANGNDLWNNTAQLNNIFGAVKVSEFESSYAYLVMADGTMKYHPDSSKINQPVANEAIKQVAEELKSGKAVKDSYVEYEYNGKTKCAAYAIVDKRAIAVVTADKSEVDALITKTVVTSVYRTLFFDIVVLIIAFIMGRLLMVPIVRITKSVRKISKLDFTHDDTTDKLGKRKDEIGLMAKAVTELNNNLRGTITEISGQSTELYATSESLAAEAGDTVNSVRQVEIAVTEVAEGAGSQAEETADATSHVITMGNMIETSSESVEQLKNSSNAISAAVKKASEILEELLEINEKASASIDMIYERTNTTNKSVEDIKSAISIITSIADETNLLSLNASIEAASAGEHGRGFAVVAAQIRKLAEQSNESAKTIEDITEKLIEDSSQAVSGMQDVRAIMVKQSANVKESSAAFDEVKDNIANSLREIEALVDVTAKIDEARAAVTDTVQNLSAIAQENAASSEESSASVTEVCNIMDKVTADTIKLKEISEKIDEQLKTFQIN